MCVFIETMFSNKCFDDYYATKTTSFKSIGVGTVYHYLCRSSTTVSPCVPVRSVP